MATFNAKEIIIWERANKRGKWCPYSADICQYLEKNHKTDIKTVCLGDIDEELRIYSVNFNDMIQISDATGTKLPIRRRLCDTLGVFARGFAWQWHDDDNTWNTYDVDINDFIDNAFLEGKKSISLNRKFHGYHYEIVFSKMIQINKRSKHKRNIRRFVNTSSYPVVLCSGDPMNIEAINLNPAHEVEDILSPDFIAQEIPGTIDLENQVNTYKRNVESSQCNGCTVSGSQLENTADYGCSKHVKYSPIEDEQSGKPQLYV